MFLVFFVPPFHFFVLFFTPTANGLRWKAVKYGGPEASKAIKRAENLAYVEPDEPTGDNTTRKETMLFERKYQQFLKKQETWEENLGKIFEKLLSHCSPTMKTKLHGMEG